MSEFISWSSNFAFEEVFKIILNHDFTRIPHEEWVAHVVFHPMNQPKNYKRTNLAELDHLNPPRTVGWFWNNSLLVPFGSFWDTLPLQTLGLHQSHRCGSLTCNPGNSSNGAGMTDLGPVAKGKCRTFPSPAVGGKKCHQHCKNTKQHIQTFMKHMKLQCGAPQLCLLVCKTQ